MEPNPTEELPWIVMAGRWLLAGSVGALTVAGAIVKIFFADRLGRGLDVAALAVLIPIWSMGIAGLLLLLVAWIRYPDLDDNLLVDIPHRPGERIFSPFTRGLACFTLVLFWLALLTLWAAPEEEISFWKKVVVFYCATTFCGFLLYLTIFYRSRQHVATTTYLNHFTLLFGTLLIPTTWPLMIVLNWTVIRRRRQLIDDVRNAARDDRRYW